MRMLPWLIRSIPVLSTFPAFAEVLVVDDDGGPGVDFTEIVDAVAVAQAGDTILVAGGQYLGFPLDRGVTILGPGFPGDTARISAGSQVAGLPFGQRAVLAGLQWADLRLMDCSGVVVLDEVRFNSSGLQTLAIESCSDVRIRDGQIPAATGTLIALDAQESTVEILQSEWFGQQPTVDSADDAAPALRLQDVELLWTASSVLAGQGGSELATCGSFLNMDAGNGGLGIDSSASLLQFQGSSLDLIKGGFAGDGGDCFCDGEPGDGLRMVGGSAYSSAVTFEGGDNYCFAGGTPVVLESGATFEEAPQLEPYLIQQLEVYPGSPARFVVFGEPGDLVILYLGRSPVQVSASTRIDQLTTRERTYALGTIGSSGNTSLLLTVPGNLPQGFSFFAQAEVQRGTEGFLKNSVPVVLR